MGDKQTTSDEAGLWILNGPQTLNAKVFSTVNSQGEKVFAFGFSNTLHQVKNTIDTTVWFKLIRDEHAMSGFYSSDGYTWIQIGQSINAAAIDVEQTQFNNFTGNQQGLCVKGEPAFFDLHIYRDAYTNITAQNPANKLGVSPSGTYLVNINSGDWAMYAGVEFGGSYYQKAPVSMELSASSATTGGVVEVWLDSIDTGRKIAQCQVDTTGSWTKYRIFRADVDSARLPDGQVSGSHDVYLKFLGTGTDQLFRINWFRFLSVHDTPTSVDFQTQNEIPHTYALKQNYPNPFNPSTNIEFEIPVSGSVTLKVFDLLGKEVATLVNEHKTPGSYEVSFDASKLSSGVYFYALRSRNHYAVRKMVLAR